MKTYFCVGNIKGSVDGKSKTGSFDFMVEILDSESPVIAMKVAIDKILSSQQGANLTREMIFFTKFERIE